MKATKDSPQYYETVEGRYEKKRKDRLVSLDERQARRAMIVYGTVEAYLVQCHGYNPEEESYSIHRNEAQSRIEYVISKYEYMKIEHINRESPYWVPPLEYQQFMEPKLTDEYKKFIAQKLTPEPPTELCFFKQSDL